jgi:hypothetical protein
MANWLRSRTACGLFLYSSWSVILVGLFMLFLVSPWSKRLEAIPQVKFPLQVLGAGLGVVGALASLIIWFGMTAFCLREDESSLTAKIFWFILFLVAAWFGSAAYFFRVYRSQVRFGSAPGGGQHGPAPYWRLTQPSGNSGRNPAGTP